MPCQSRPVGLSKANGRPVDSHFQNTATFWWNTLLQGGHFGSFHYALNWAQVKLLDPIKSDLVRASGSRIWTSSFQTLHKTLGCCTTGQWLADKFTVTSHPNVLNFHQCNHPIYNTYIQIRLIPSWTCQWICLNIVLYTSTVGWPALNALPTGDSQHWRFRSWGRWAKGTSVCHDKQ